MPFATRLAAFKRDRVQRDGTEIVRRTVLEFADAVVTQWSPYGDPTLWKSPPPAGYVPGNFQSSWFLAVGAPSGETTDATNHREAHHIGRLADFKLGETIYLTNSAAHAGALEAGHSTQAPVGIMWSAQEFSPMAAAVARRVAS